MTRSVLPEVIAVDRSDSDLRADHELAFKRSNQHTINVKTDYGAVGDDVTDDTAAIQAAIDDATTFGQSNFGDGRTCGIYFPAGKYRVSSALGLTETADGNANLRLKGEHYITTQIRHLDDTTPVFSWSTTTGNLRYFSIEDMMLRGGTNGLRLDRVKYALFRNVAFFQNAEYAIYIEQGGNNRFESLNMVENVNDAVYLEGGTGDIFTGCQFGELTGAVYVNSTTAHFVGGKFYGMEDRQVPGGYASMGAAMFTVYGGGSLRIAGAYLGPTASVVNAQNHRSVSIDSSTIEWDVNAAHNGHIINSDGTSRDGELSLRDNTVVLRRTASTVDVVKTTAAARTIENSVVGGNTFHILTGNTVQIDDDLNDPSLGNQLFGNTIHYPTTA